MSSEKTYCQCNSLTNPCIVCGLPKFIDREWLKRKIEEDGDEGEIGAGFELFPLPAPMSPDAVNARLRAAAPKLVDALKGLIGLCQLVRNRGDLPTDARQALTHNHRIIAAYEALSAAGIEGFQPSDFDAAKAQESRP